MASNKCFSIFIAVFHSLTLWIVSWVAHLAPLLLFVVFFFGIYFGMFFSFLLHHRIEAQTRLCWLIEPQLQPCLLLWLLASSISLSISPSIFHFAFCLFYWLIMLSLCQLWVLFLEGAESSSYFDKVSIGRLRVGTETGAAAGALDAIKEVVNCISVMRKSFRDSKIFSKTLSQN